MHMNIQHLYGEILCDELLSRFKGVSKTLSQILGDQLQMLIQIWGKTWGIGLNRREL